MHTLNLGILAHVDAGKTSLSERLRAGSPSNPPSSRSPSTTAWSISSTPGRPDFIAEVKRVHELRQRLPALTRGEGVLESAVARYRPVQGPVPIRRRTDANPLDRQEYLLHVNRRM